MDKRTCTVIENGVLCSDPAYARSLCRIHYDRWRRHGDPLSGASRERHIESRRCDFPGCDNLHKARGYCQGHLRQLEAGKELTPLHFRPSRGTCPAVEDDGSTCGLPITRRGYCRKHYQRQWIAANRKNRAASSRAYRQRKIAKEGIEAVREAERAYGRAHPKKARKSRKRGPGQRNAETAKKHAEYMRRWRKRHPEAWATDRARRRVRVTVEFTTEDRAESMAWRKLIKDDPCYYCGTPETHHVDHYISLANGGTEHWWNLVKACRTCNQRKNRMNGDDFLRLLGKERDVPAA